MLLVAQGIGNMQWLEAANADDITGLRFFYLDPLQTVMAHHFEDSAIALFTIGANGGNRGIGFDFATGNTAHTDNAEEVVVVQCGNLHLERAVHIHLGRLYKVHHGQKQRIHVLRHFGRVHTSNAVQGTGVHNRAVQLLVSGTQIVKQVENLVNNPVWTCTRTVDFVDHYNGAQSGLKRFLGDKTGLRHRTVNGVDHQQYAVNHAHHPLDLTAKIGVTGGVDDIDSIVLPFDGGIFRQNGNAALFFLVVGVHHTVGFQLLAIQGPGGTQQGINQGCFAMIDVGNDGDVSQFLNHSSYL